MNRGEIWTVAGGPDYTGKPRPAVILQDDVFDATASITICPFTIHHISAPLLRLTVEPSARNRLHAASELSIDKITTVSGPKLQRLVGRLSPADVVRLKRAVIVFLGLAGSTSSGQHSD